jgi:hypothetical protein
MFPARAVRDRKGSAFAFSQGRCYTPVIGARDEEF